MSELTIPVFVMTMDRTDTGVVFAARVKAEGLATIPEKESFLALCRNLSEYGARKFYEWTKSVEGESTVNAQTMGYTGEVLKELTTEINEYQSIKEAKANG